MYHFIVNQHAGGGRSAKKWELLKNHLDISDIPYVFRTTTTKGHASTIAREWENGGIDFVISVGGDGTLHEIINGRTDLASLTLGVIPTGTGNDFSLPLGIPKNPVSAFKLIETCTPTEIDLIDVGGRRAICFATSGIDVALVEGANQLRKKGKLSYLRMLLKELRKDKTYAFSVESADKKEVFDTFFIGVSTNGVVASGMKLCPPARVDDGILDLVIMEKRKKIQLPKQLLSLYNGKILELENVHHLKGESFSIRPLTLHAVDLDGELYYDNVFDLKILKKACKFILPS